MMPGQAALDEWNGEDACLDDGREAPLRVLIIILGMAGRALLRALLIILGMAGRGTEVEGETCGNTDARC
jgi:hypothetical protein